MQPHNLPLMPDNDSPTMAYTAIISTPMEAGDTIAVGTGDGERVIQLTEYHGGAVIFSGLDSEGVKRLFAFQEDGQCHELKSQESD
jgi:hypothetical protein